MTKPVVARICWVHEKVLRKGKSVQSVHFWGCGFFQIPYGWAEEWREPVSCSPCLSRGWITAARNSTHHLTVSSSLFSASTSQSQNRESSGWQATLSLWAASTWSNILCLGSIYLVHSKGFFGTNLYCHRKNNHSQMKYLLSCLARINTTSWSKQFYPPSSMKRQLQTTAKASFSTCCSV